MYKYKIPFQLNEYQTKASLEILKAYQNQQDSILEAVCGAGKTEITLLVISYVLNNGGKVGFAIPRKQLVYELKERICMYFNEETFGMITGDVKVNIQSNLIFLTTHQLRSYPNYFDLLLIDEVDAFPYCDNLILEKAALLSSKRFVYISATLPEKYLNKGYYHISINKRHHLKTNPRPELIIYKKGLGYLSLYKYIKKLKKEPLLIYVKDIKTGYKLEKFIKKVCPKTIFVSSKNITQDIIKAFASGHYKIMISTTVLERGITLKQLNVIVYEANSYIFNDKTLIQICGRVGRDTIYYQGKVYFISTHNTKEIKACLKSINDSNK